MIENKEKRKKLLKLQLSAKSQKKIEDIPFKKFLYVSAVINIVTISFVVISRKYLPPIVPLFYGLAKSESQLAPNIYLVLPNTLASLILFLNILMTFLFENDHIKKTLIVTPFIVTILSTITTIKIIFLIGSF